MNSSPQSVGLFLDERTLWAACVESPLFGGPVKLVSSFKYELLGIPEDSAARLQFLSEVVKLSIAKLGVKTSAVAMVFADADTFVRYFEMPMIPEADLRSAIGYEAQKYLPFASRELYSDYKVFQHHETKKQGILFGAAKKETVDLWKQAIARAGYTLDFVETEGMAFFWLMRRAAQEAATAELKIYAGLKHGGFLTFIVARGEEILMNHRAKIPPPMSVVGQEPKKIDGDAVARQITALLNYFSKTFRGLEPKSLRVLVDPGCAEENLGPVLHAQLGFPVHVVSSAKFFGGTPVEVSYSQLIALMSAAFRSGPLFGRASKKPMNLIRVRSHKGPYLDVTPLNWEQERKQLERLVIMEITALVGVFLLFHLFYGLQIGKNQKKTASFQSTIVSSGVSVDAPNGVSLETSRAALQSKISAAAALFDRRVYWTPKLSEVSRLMPHGTELSVLEIEDRQGKDVGTAKSLRLEGRMQGEGDDLSVLNQFVDSLRASAVFSQGIESIKMSKTRKILNSKGESTGSLFFIDSQSLGAAS